MNNYFDKYALKGNEFLEVLADDLQCPGDIPRAARILRSVFHIIRGQVPPEVSLQFIAQLPMVIKALYVEGWKHPEVKPRLVDHPDALIIAVYAGENPRVAGQDFKNKDEVIQAIHAVVKTIRRYVSDGEWADVLAVMPAGIRNFLQAHSAERFHLL